jgi:hypothetical protein
LCCFVGRGGGGERAFRDRQEYRRPASARNSRRN